MSRAERKQLVKEASENLHNVEIHSNGSDLDTINIANSNGSTTKVGQTKPGISYMPSGSSHCAANSAAHLSPVVDGTCKDFRIR